MSKSKVFILQALFILSVALVPSLFVIRVYMPTKVLAESITNEKEEEYINPFIGFIKEEEKEISKPKVSPTLIMIPNIDLELEVGAGEIVDNKWTLFEDKVAWLATSAEPGGGNIILYAHNRDELFGPLHGISEGEEIIVEHNGWEYIYEVAEKRKVKPIDVDSVLSDEEQLTLYTCDGTFDQRRLVVIAKPKLQE